MHTWGLETNKPLQYNRGYLSRQGLFVRGISLSVRRDLFQLKLITKIDITKIDISHIERKGRKIISDASKRLRGTDQPCRIQDTVGI
jgi:hypothetical protein